MGVVPQGSPTRIVTAIACSVVANAALWYLLSAISSHVPTAKDPPVLTFTRVTMDEKGIKHEKIIKPADVKKKIEKLKPPPEKPKERPVVQHKDIPPPEGAHNKLLTQKTPDKQADPDNKVLDGGQAKLGDPTDGQKPGNQVVNPDTSTTSQTPSTTTQPATNPPVTNPPPTAPSTNTNDKPPPQPPPPPPPPPPAPKGPTADAQPLKTVDVEIPETLKTQSFKSFVRVRVNVAADGSFEVILRTTSGNPDVDKLVLEALKQWKWKPALKDGEPIESQKLFRFEFEVK